MARLLRACPVGSRGRLPLPGLGTTRRRADSRATGPDRVARRPIERAQPEEVERARVPRTRGGSAMTVMKEMQFPVSVRWRGGRLARAESSDKEPLEVATPAEFRSGLAGYWS